MPQAMPTKEVILRKSIHLFAEDGYESVSMKTIARATGIQAASIYNHYRSKEEILSAIYQRYKDICFLPRVTAEEYIPILKKGTALEIMDIFNYPTPDENEEDPIYFDITRIIWGRLYIDEDASELYREYVVEASAIYIREVVKKGIELGQIKMSPDEIRTFATIILACRAFTVSAVVVDPDQAKWRRQETSFMELLFKLLELNPPLEE